MIALIKVIIHVASPNQKHVAIGNSSSNNRIKNNTSYVHPQHPMGIGFDLRGIEELALLSLIKSTYLICGM